MRLAVRVSRQARDLYRRSWRSDGCSCCCGSETAPGSRYTPLVRVRPAERRAFRPCAVRTDEAADSAIAPTARSPGRVAGLVMRHECQPVAESDPPDNRVVIGALFERRLVRRYRFPAANRD